MAGRIGDWNIPPEKRHVVEYSYRGGENQFTILNEKLKAFADHKLVERIENSPLGHMYKAMGYFHYGCFLPYQILSRSVYTDKKEFLIRLGDSTCRLGRMEFALISGLSFKEVEADTRSILEKECTSLIARKDPKTGLIDTNGAPFLKPLQNITIKDIEDELKNATEAELAFKIGLIYLIESVMHGKKLTTAVSPFVFWLVEDTNRFLSYPWGTHFWDLSLEVWNAKIRSMKKQLNEKQLMKKPPNGKDSKRHEIYSLVSILFVWAYETLLGEGASYMEGSELHVTQDNSVRVPRILRWRPIKGRLHNNKLCNLLDTPSLRVNRYLKPNEDEVRMLRGNGLMDDEISNPPHVYPAPVVSPDLPSPEVASPLQVNVAFQTQRTRAPINMTTHTATSTQATPTISRAYDVDLCKIIDDIRVEISNGSSVTMEKVRADLNEARRRIGVLKEQFEAFKEATRREIFAIREEVTAQNRQLLDLMRIVSNRDGIPIVSDGRYVDAQPPPHGEGEPVYRSELHPAYQTQLHQQVQMQQKHQHQRTVINEVERGVESSQVERDVYDRNRTKWVKDGIEEPYNDFNAVTDTEETSLSGHERKGKRQHGMVDKRESPDAKRVRVESKCSLKERICKLRKWLKSSNSIPISIPTRVSLRGSFADAILGPDWFEDILRPKGNFTQLHVDCYMNLLKRRILGYPEAFKPGSVLFEQQFGPGFVLFKQKIGDEMASDFLPHSELHAPVWKPDTTAYALWEIESDHWVAVVISVKEWTIYVYDSLDENENTDAIKKHLYASANYMRVAMESSPAVQDLPEMVDSSKPPFKIDFLDDYKLPRMKGSGDCVVYAIKYIEELATGGDIKRVCDQNINDFRMQICADLYCQYMGV